MAKNDWTSVRKRWEHSLVLVGRKPSTVKQRLSHMDRLVKSRYGDWLTLTADELTAYLAQPSWQSPQTRRTFQSAITAFYSWATAEGLLEVDPTVTVHKISTNTNLNPSTPARREAIREALENAEPREAMMIKLAFIAGLKAHEIAVTHASDVYEDEHRNWMLHVHRSSTVTREVAIPATFADELRVIPGYLFPGRVEGHVSAAYVSKLISNAMPGDETAEEVRLAYKRILERNVAVDVWRDVGQFHSPVNLRLLMYTELRSSRDIPRQLDHIAREIEHDPGEAIDNAKKFLESLFKLILADLGQPVRDAPKLPDLYHRVAVALDLSEDPMPGNERASKALKATLGNLVNTVNNVAALRNGLAGHGRFDESRAEPIHARLAFNATVALAEFIAARWAAQTNREV